MLESLEWKEITSLDEHDQVLRREVHLQFNLALDEEDKFWSLRADKLWIKKGERSTGFFHRIAITKYKRNTVSSLLIEGVLVED